MIEIDSSVMLGVMNQAYVDQKHTVYIKTVPQVSVFKIILPEWTY